MNAREIVRSGYDRLGPRYWEWSRDNDPKFRETYIERGLGSLSPGSLVVELGSGSGVPTAQMLSQHHRVVCVDFSFTQLAGVEKNAPEALRVAADMSDVAFAPSSIDAVVAFYSIIHVPRDNHADILASIERWLRPGGVFVASLGAGDNPDDRDEWIGVPMYWSHYDAPHYVALIEAVGLELVADDVLENFEDGRSVHFLWVIARKPA